MFIKLFLNYIIIKMGDTRWNTDEREIVSKFNRKGKPTLIYKIRKIVRNNRTGDVNGITIPQHIANQFVGCHFMITTQGTNIVLESGCKVDLIKKRDEDAKNILAV